MRIDKAREDSLAAQIDRVRRNIILPDIRIRTDRQYLAILYRHRLRLRKTAIHRIDLPMKKEQAGLLARMTGYQDHHNRKENRNFHAQLSLPEYTQIPFNPRHRRSM